MSQSFSRRSQPRRSTWRNEPAPDVVPARAGFHDRIPEWGEADPTLWRDYSLAVITARNLCSFSTSSDGGVIHCFILAGGQRIDWYCRTVAELEHSMRVQLEHYQRHGYPYVPED